MQPDPPKWYCRCGQINAGYQQKCVNCGGPRSEGSTEPPSLDEVLNSGSPIAPSRLMGNVTSRIIHRARVHADDQELVVTERRTGRWIGFLLLAFASSLLVFFLSTAMPTRDRRGSVVLMMSSMATVPTLLFGVFFAFPHIRLTVTRSGRECTILRRWLLFTYASRRF